MRELISEIVQDAPIIVGINGSYARREVTSGSDVDLIVLASDEIELTDAVPLLECVHDRLCEAGFKLAASGGVFDDVTRGSNLYSVIGGQEDDNVNITRRMLLLLEGEWLYDQPGFNALRDSVLRRYVNDKIREDQIALFLLNDIIRYWRTICVDYEHKIGNGKAAEIRLLKLRFSRMLLYMGGVVAVGMTFEKSASEKRKILRNLLCKPPAERIASVLGSRVDKALSIYAKFLSAINDEKTRAELSTARESGAYSERYKEFREDAKVFRTELKNALEEKFPAPHPLLPALML